MNLCALFSVGLGIFLSVGMISPAGGEPQKNEKFTIRRGTNISHWLSQSERRGVSRVEWFTKKDVAYLAGLGFDHLRIPVDEEQLWDEKGNPNAEAFGLLNDSLDWCAEYGLRAIVDLHILRSHHFNQGEKPLWTDPAAQERFLQCWRELSAFLKNRPASMVAYELLNEPVATDHEDWNKLLNRAVAVIRETEPTRMIFIGSNKWQTPGTFHRLRLPENDPNLYLSFHMYEPFIFTHYRASWTDVTRRYKGPVQYPGMTISKEAFAAQPPDLQKQLQGEVRPYNKDAMLERLSTAIKVAKEHNLPLCCTEWGCLPNVPENERVQWYRDLRAVMEENGIAWSTWDYKGSFGLIDGKGKPQTALIDALMK
jgi:endoglucanase